MKHKTSKHLDFAICFILQSLELVQSNDLSSANKNYYS